MAIEDKGRTVERKEKTRGGSVLITCASCDCYFLSSTIHMTCLKSQHIILYIVNLTHDSGAVIWFANGFDNSFDYLGFDV